MQLKFNMYQGNGNLNVLQKVAENIVAKMQKKKNKKNSA